MVNKSATPFRYVRTPQAQERDSPDALYDIVDMRGGNERVMATRVLYAAAVEITNALNQQHETQRFFALP